MVHVCSVVAFGDPILGKSGFVKVFERETTVSAGYK